MSDLDMGRSTKARHAEVPSLDLLARVLRGVKRIGTVPSADLVLAPVPRREMPLTAGELPDGELSRVPGYPKSNALDPRASRYAATMRRVNADTGTTGLGDYWQQPGVFTVDNAGSGRFWQGPGYIAAAGAA